MRCVLVFGVVGGFLCFYVLLVVVGLCGGCSLVRSLGVGWWLPSRILLCCSGSLGLRG